MKTLLSIVYLALITTIALSTRTVHNIQLNDDPADSPFFEAINTMLKIYSLPPSRQIPTCFETNEKDLMLNIVKNITYTGSQAGTT